MGDSKSHLHQADKASAGIYQSLALTWERTWEKLTFAHLGWVFQLPLFSKATYDCKPLKEGTPGIQRAGPVQVVHSAQWYKVISSLHLSKLSTEHLQPGIGLLQHSKINSCKTLQKHKKHLGLRTQMIRLRPSRFKQLSAWERPAWMTRHSDLLTPTLRAKTKQKKNKREKVELLFLRSNIVHTMASRLPSSSVNTLPPFPSLLPHLFS